MSRDELIKAVALHMDEVTPDNGYAVAVDGSDNNPLYALINGLIEDCTLELFSVAPYWRLPNTKFTAQEIGFDSIFSGTPYERKIIRLKVNDAFFRVAEINHEAFRRPITEVVPEQSAEGRAQHNPYIVGKCAKPVGVMSHGEWSGTPCREIDCYSIDDDDTQAEASKVTAFYIAKPAAIATTGASAVEAVVPLVLAPALEWLIAARTFGARGDANHAAICQQNAQNLLV